MGNVGDSGSQNYKSATTYRSASEPKVRMITITNQPVGTHKPV
ncbi:hypothetical protein EDE05_14321 [Neorhizobium sp. R1-B]|jgi:hypothetical protein|nr:hypothetical protein EDE05_14321 [Neorhizobium sp. R1-B]